MASDVAKENRVSWLEWSKFPNALLKNKLNLQIEPNEISYAIKR